MRHLRTLSTRSLVVLVAAVVALAVGGAAIAVAASRSSGPTPPHKPLAQALWYAANAHFGRGMLAACGLAVLAVLALRGLGGLGADAFVAASAATLAIPLLAAVAATWRFVRAWQRRDRGVRPK